MYKAVLFSTDGDWVTDHHYKTIDEVWEALADQGSKWFFYPLQFVIRDYGKHFTTDNQRIIDTCDMFPEMKGKSIKTVSKYVSAFSPEFWNAVF